MSRKLKPFHIKEIKIPNDTHFFKEDDETRGTVLRNISKVNIFIGANNSGKSKLLNLRNLTRQKYTLIIPFFLPAVQA